MVQTDKLLRDYSVTEKTAYLKAITALATADRTATEDEVYLLDAIAESAELPEQELASLHATPRSRRQKANCAKAWTC